MTIIIMTELKFLLIFFGCLYHVTQDDDNDDHNEYNEDCDDGVIPDDQDDQPRSLFMDRRL